MVSIKYYKHTFSSECEILEASSVADWIINSSSGSIVVYKDSLDVTEDHKLLSGNSGAFTVLETPADPVSLINAGLYFFGKAVVDLITLDVPSPSSAQNSSLGSANNQLSGRANKARILQRVEDIYGEVRSIPTLLMTTYTKYKSNIAFEYSYMCVGRGYYDISDVRDGDTPAASIGGTDVNFYEPFTSPNSGDSPSLVIGDVVSEKVLLARRSNEVDGITLKAPNEVNLSNPDNYTYTPGVKDTITQVGTAKPSFDSVAEIGDDIIISMAPVTVSLSSSFVAVISANSFFSSSIGAFNGAIIGASVVVSGFLESANNGIFTVVSVSGDGKTLVIVENTLVAEVEGEAVQFDQSVDYSGTYEVDSAIEKVITLTTSTFTSTISNNSSSVTLIGKTEWTDWSVLDRTDRNQIFVNIVARQGIYKDDGGGKTNTQVDYEIQVEELDSSLVPTGNITTYPSSISGSTGDERANTEEITTSYTGPARVRARRSSDFDFGFGGAIVDEIKFDDLYGVSPISNLDFGDVTTVYSVTRATSRATALKERQLNALVTRKIPTYNGSVFSGLIDDSGKHVSGTIHPTKRFVDIVAAISLDPFVGGVSLTNDVDITQIYNQYLSISAWSSEYADFSYTFDSDNTSYEESIRIIADACFCQAYRQNSKIRFNFEREQTDSVALFTHRNKKPNSETITRSFSSDSDYDGIELTYTDPDTEKQETIKIPDDANKYKKIEPPGIREFSTAWVRASRELNKLLFSRIAIQTSTTTDARLLLPYSRVDIVDNTRIKSFDGEVIAQDGNLLTLSKEVQFTGGETHSIVLMKRGGGLESVVCTIGTFTNEVILTSLPVEPIVTNHGQDGIRTIYSFSADTNRSSQAYLVQEISSTEKSYVTVRAINYSDKYYQDDSATIPAKDTIIN